MTARNKSKRRKYGENGFEQWGGYMNAKITKLEEQYEEESKKLSDAEKLSNIFEGISIFVNGYTEPSADDLRLLMLLHGGTYHHYYRSDKTTHVIASNLPNAKMMQLKTMKVVRPEWLAKSVEAGKLLDYKNFLLFAKPSALQRELNFVPKNREVEQGKHPPEQGIPKQGVAKTAVDSQFLSEFYNNSRLHHLSTMGAMFKEYVMEIKQKHDGAFPGRKRILDSLRRETRDAEAEILDKVVMHIDMDCFFVSVALRNNPELVGKPVAVTHARGNPTHQRAGVNREFEYKAYKKRMEAKLGVATNRPCDESDESDEERTKSWFKEPSSMSEIASCSYEARKAGVCNGMYLGSALKLCPNLLTVPYDFEGYKEVSFSLYDTIAEYTLDIEAVSCDELFVDCTSLLRETNIGPSDFASLLRKEIFDRTRCPSSVGIGSNKLQARLATKRAKPDGQFCVTPLDVANFVGEFDICDLPGVGRTMGHKLRAMDVRTCLDLQGVPMATLKKEFGNKTGEMLYKYCRGIDDRAVNSNHQRKSVSAEVNYGIRFAKEDEAITFLRQLSGEVSNRLKNLDLKGRNITFKVMTRTKDAPVETAKFLGHGVCDYATRSTHLSIPSNDPEIIAKNVINMYKQLSLPAVDLRGIGIQVTKLEKIKTARGGLSDFLKPKTEDKTPPAPPPPPKASDAPPKRNFAPKESSKALPPLSQLDRSVLDSLPPEIRREILNEYGMSGGGGGSQERSTSRGNSSPAAAPPQEAAPKEASAFVSLSVPQMRMMIGEWVAAEVEPKEFDVEMLADYVCRSVRKKQLEDVDVLMKCLWRHIAGRRSGNKDWSECYGTVVDRLQASMRDVFGKELLVREL